MENNSRSIKPVHLFSAIKAVLTVIALAAFSAIAQPANGLLMETWNGISGTSVANLTSNPAYPNSPTTRSYLTLFETASNVAENFGSRVRGYVTPPTTGSYTFWIASDDNSELWLSTDANPANTRRIALVPGSTFNRAWTRYPEQQSVAITLTGGQRYYIETLFKEGTSSDNLAVGWRGPGITGEAERPIPASRLTPFILSSSPVITTQPANRTVNLGQTANFSVVATGSGLSYQWRKNAVNIPGATSATYTTPATLAADNGALFSVVVTNSAGSVTSANASLTVILPPVITTQPANQTVNLGQTATFSVGFTGTSPTFQWRKNGVNISGATSSSYTTPATVASDDNAQFSVVLSNAAATETSANARLTVVTPLTIVTHPANRTVNLGQTAAFSVVATGVSLTYQWRLNGVAIPGATSANYTTPATVASDDNSTFSVIVSNSSTSLISNNAILTVRIPPTITTQPAGITVPVPLQAQFTVVAAGTAPLSYQWRKNGVNISGATLPAYTTPATTLADNGAIYSVIVTNLAGNVTSENAVLNVYTVVPNNKKLAISGNLFDNAGNPLGYPDPVTVNVTVKLMNALTGGNAVYTENFFAANGKACRVENSLFVVRLGEGIASGNLQQTIAANPNLWVEITVDDGTPDILAPRTPLTAAAYSLGGTSTLGVSQSELRGVGNPNTLEIKAALGTVFVNTEDNSTWFKISNGWKLMD